MRARVELGGGLVLLAVVGATLLVWSCLACAPAHLRPYPRLELTPRAVHEHWRGESDGAEHCSETFDPRKVLCWREHP